MSGIDRADAFARWWVDRYTAALPAPVADRRRAEIRSDVGEQRAWAATTQTAPVRLAASIVRRVVVGMVADLWWRRAQLAAARGRTETSGAHMWSWMRRTWWQALAVLLGGIEVGTGVSWPIEEPSIGAVVGGAITGAAGLLTIAGVAVRRRHRVRGDVMIAVGVLPFVSWYWTYVFPAAAVTVLAAALVDAADARPSHTAALPPTGDRVRVGLVVALVAALAGSVFLDSPGAAVVLVSPLLAALVTHAVVGGRADLVPSTRAGVLLVGVGIGNAIFVLVARLLGDVDGVAVPGSAASAAAAFSALVILVGCGLLVVGWSRQPPSPTSHRH